MDDERCGKVVYESRAAARSARRRFCDAGLRPYRCVVCPESPWHLGHLPLVVRSGHAGRADVYRRRT